MLSLVLRHKPAAIGIAVDNNGWTPVSQLIQKMNNKGFKITFETLCYVVENNNKKRFAFNADKTKIRASQGHSLSVDLGYESQIPPAVLYHGTGLQSVESILSNGLLKKNRQHVHLSTGVQTAKKVGQRKGQPVVLIIDSAQMQQKGFHFFVSENTIWLTDHVPSIYIQVFK